MHILPNALNTEDPVLSGFEERFAPYRDRRIGLCPGMYREEIVRLFGGAFDFLPLTEEGTVPEDAGMLILTDPRFRGEPDYCRVREECDARGVPVLDLFGLEQAALHAELEQHEYLTMPQWKEFLADYDVVTMTAEGVAMRRQPLYGKLLPRRRFLILYRWLKEHGKTVVFLWDNEEQLEALKEGVAGPDDYLLKREGPDLGFLTVKKRFEGKKVLHVGFDPARDGIAPRESGVESRLIRHYVFTGIVPDPPEREWFHADKEQLMQAIREHDVISFDIFDTLIKRTVLDPKTVFRIAEERTGVRGFADARYHVQTTQYRLNLDEFYEILQREQGYDGATVKLLKETELRLEAEIIRPRRAMVEIFDYAKNLGKTVILVSDMYLDEDYLRKLLEKNGIAGYSELYISCYYRKLKFEGLYEEVLKNRKPRETVLHIGDNRYGDVTCARKWGLDAFYIPSGLEMAKNNGYEKAVQMCRTAAEEKLLGLAIAEGFDDPFALHTDTLISDMVVAPLVMGYLEWVCARLKEKPYDYFLLSSRDGKILEDAYERLRQRTDGLPPGKYFYTNRHAAFLTIMDDPQKVRCFIFYRDYEDEPARMLRRLCLQPEEKILPYHGEDPEEFYLRHLPQIREDAEKYRANYRRYLEREGLDGKFCAVMDFVSEGSSQLMLEQKITGKMDGFYFGAPEYLTRYSPNIRYYLDRDLMDYPTEMHIEVYFTSQEPAVDRIGPDGEPVFAPETRERRVLDRIASIHERVREYLLRYVDTLYDPWDEISTDLIFELCRTVNQYRVDNYYFDDMTARRIRTEA